MLVSEQQRLLFVHVQKTGGVSVEAVLKEALPDAWCARRRHQTMAQMLNSHPEWADFYVVGFVRNPFARMVSWWSMFERWREDQAGPRKESPHTSNDFWHAMAALESFEQFVLEAPKKWPRLRRPQIDYLRTPQRRADFIGRTETLTEDLGQLVARLGRPDLAPVHHNRSEHGHYSDYYTPAMRAQVERLFRADLDEFGYTFEAR